MLNPTEKKLISGRGEVELLVNTFYERVQKDDLIGPIFNEIAKIDWDHHLPKMYAFWDDLLFANDSYRGRPFPPHMKFDLTREHFDRWVSLFTQTVDDLFVGLKADEVKIRAQRIALNFQINLGLVRLDLEKKDLP